MFVDLVAVLLLLAAIFKGWSKGLVLAFFSFAAFFVGLAAALKLSTLAAYKLSSVTSISPRWLPFIAFILVFILVVLLIRIGAKAIETFLRISMLGWANRLGGVFLFVIIYFMIFSVLLFYTTRLGLLSAEILQASKCYPVLQPFAPKVMDAMGVIIPWFKNMFAQLEQFFTTFSDGVRAR